MIRITTAAAVDTSHSVGLKRAGPFHPKPITALRRAWHPASAYPGRLSGGRVRAGPPVGFGEGGEENKGKHDCPVPGARRPAIGVGCKGCSHLGEHGGQISIRGAGETGGRAGGQRASVPH